MIAVIGASGHLGKATLNSLVQKTTPESIVAIGRDARKLTEFADKGVNVRQADYGDYESLVAAFAGVDTVLLVSSSVLGDERVQQHRNGIEAAKAAGVTRVVYTSATNPALDAAFAPAIDHFKTENLLKESGLVYTIVRDNFYLDILPMLLGDAAQSGKLYLPAGDGKVSYALRTDMAEALATILIGEGHENKVYDLGANTAWSFADVATILQRATGKPVEYIDIPNDAYVAELVKHVPEGLAQMLSGMVEAIKKNDFNEPSSTLEDLLGRPPVTLEAFLATQA